MENNEL